MKPYKMRKDSWKPHRHTTAGKKHNWDRARRAQRKSVRFSIKKILQASLGQVTDD